MDSESRQVEHESKPPRRIGAAWLALIAVSSLLLALGLWVLLVLAPDRVLVSAPQARALQLDALVLTGDNPEATGDKQLSDLGRQVLVEALGWDGCLVIGHGTPVSCTECIGSFHSLPRSPSLSACPRATGGRRCRRWINLNLGRSSKDRGLTAGSARGGCCLSFSCCRLRRWPCGSASVGRRGAG